MTNFILKNFNLLFIFTILLLSSPTFSADGGNYKHFIGITLDEKFWVLIAFILFLLLVGKKATQAANTALDNRSSTIKEKINHAESALLEAKQLLINSQKALSSHKSESDELIRKQKQLAEKNAIIYANKIEEEIKRKNISTEREIQYMHSEAIALIKDKITSITLKSVEEIAINEFKNSKSDIIYENFISDIPKALK
jgi:F-type H+-transporting ATPase subunit b